MPAKNYSNYSNKPYDEAYELSQDLSVAESFDGRDKVTQMVELGVYETGGDRQLSLKMPGSAHMHFSAFA